MRKKLTNDEYQVLNCLKRLELEVDRELIAIVKELIVLEETRQMLVENLL